jgi:hypothetical protein
VCVQGAAHIPDKGVAKALAVARPISCGLHIPAGLGSTGGAHLVGRVWEAQVGTFGELSV